ncbi:MAG: hypothetical protein M0C28_13075 [Candidatus Moduliflexus flocculans]|nr:hypothetical protein [Candidatus Moduliflexus flocculans]
MKKTALVLFLAGLFASAGPASAFPAEKKVQISLGLNVAMLSESYGNDSQGHVAAPGCGSISTWGASFIGRSRGCPPGSAAVVRRRHSQLPVRESSSQAPVIWPHLSAGVGRDWGINSLFKVHAGAKTPELAARLLVM